jgi:hypothetical protein
MQPKPAPATVALPIDCFAPHLTLDLLSEPVPRLMPTIFFALLEVTQGRTIAQIDLGFNRSMQHLKFCMSRRSVADEAKTKDLLFG